MPTRIKPVRINSTNRPEVWNWPRYASDDDFQWDNLVWDMQYADFRRALKQGDVTIENLRTYTTPTANFTISAWTELKEWQIYLLRVNQWSTVYAATLWNNITNPNGMDATMQPNKMNVFEFVATSSSQLEYQWISSSYLDLTTNQVISGLKTFTVLPQSSATPTNNNDLVTKGYVDTRTVNTADESTATDSTVLYIITDE